MRNQTRAAHAEQVQMHHYPLSNKEQQQHLPTLLAEARRPHRPSGEKLYTPLPAMRSSLNWPSYMSALMKK
jgi:hypothetical protein